MVEEDIKSLEKEVSKRKRLASEWAGRMHDLAEERLPEGFEEIHEIAEGAYNACLAWKEAVEALRARQQAGGEGS